jgi:hypothetical protein
MNDAYQVEDEHVHFPFGCFLAQTIGDSSSGRLVDDAKHIEASNNA